MWRQGLQSGEQAPPCLEGPVEDPVNYLLDDLGDICKA